MNIHDDYDNKENPSHSPRMKDVMASSSLADVVANKALAIIKVPIK